MKKTRRISVHSKQIADLEQSGTNTVIHGTLFFDRDIPLSVLMKVMNDVNEMPRFGERFNRTTMEFEPLMNWDVSRQIHEIPSRRWRILSKLIRDFTEFGVTHPHTSHESSSCSRKDGVPKTSLKSTNRSLLMQDVSNYMNEIYDLAFPDGAPLWEIHVLRMFDTDDQASESDSQSKQTESPTLPVQPNLSVKKETEENLQCGCIIIVRVSHIIGDGTSLVVAVGKALSRCGSSGNLEDAAHPPDVTMPRAKKRALAQSHQHPWYVKHIYGILAWVSAVIHLAYLFLTYRAPRASLFPQSHPCGNDLRLRNVFRSNRSKVVLGATSGKEERKANGTRRMFFLDPIELSEMKMVGYALNNATVNDIITACIHGSLRRVMLENSQKGCEDELVLEGRKTLYSILAVNLQPLTSFSNFNEIAQERIGNRSSFMSIPLQLENEENATAMLLRITNLMRRLKLSPQRFCYYYGISWARCLSPRSLTMHCSKRFTMNCPLMLTNVVGPPYSCEMNSAKLLHTYFFASPGSQTPISALILSYSGRVYISLMTHGFSEEAMETMQNLPSYILSMWEELRTQAISVRSSNHGFPEAKTQSVKKNV